MDFSIKYDPIEDTKEYKDIADELEEKINCKMILLDMPTSAMGSCHFYWTIKKSILKEDYDIDWKSPEELNLNIIFD